MWKNNLPGLCIGIYYHSFSPFVVDCSMSWFAFLLKKILISLKTPIVLILRLRQGNFTWSYFEVAYSLQLWYVIYQCVIQDHFIKLVRPWFFEISPVSSSLHLHTLSREIYSDFELGLLASRFAIDQIYLRKKR